MQNPKPGFLIVLSIFWLLFQQIAFAENADNLYQIALPAAATQNAEVLLPDALSQLLIKLSDNPDITKIPAIQNAIQQASTYVKSYQFLINPNQSSARTLSVTFDPNSIKSLLNASKQSIKTSSNTATPLVLVWLIYQTPDGEKQWISPDSPEPAVDLISLDNAAQANGIKLIWPTLDLTDINNVQIDRAASLDATLFNQASERYHVKAILAGVLTHGAENGWQSHWLLINQSQSENFNYNQANLADIYQPLFSALKLSLNTNANSADHDASHDAQTISLSVNNIQNLDDYAKVTKYLQQLGAVSKVEPLSVDNQTMTLNVTVEGGVNGLLNALNLPAATPATSETLTLNWENEALTLTQSVTPSVAPENDDSINPVISPEPDNDAQD